MDENSTTVNMTSPSSLSDGFNQTMIDPDLYQKYLDNRSVSDAIFFFFVIVHGILVSISFDITTVSKKIDRLMDENKYFINEKSIHF